MGALDGRVAIVTGAGRGIGREHALLFAREGAKVVVNDLGGSSEGVGADTSPAQQVVDEIRAFGGEAVSNTDNVASWIGAASLVNTAVAQFGRLDVLVNNAGILRDGFIASLEESSWDAVINVHLKGHVATLHFAAQYWKAQSKSGMPVSASVINTASGSGLILPNAGQANYGAAKAAIAALTLVAAEELARYGVRVNAIAPIARTRLTLAAPGMSSVFNAELEEGEFDFFSPANISPMVAYLASEGCTFSGQVFAVQGGAIQRLEGWRAVDVTETDSAWTIADIDSRIAGWA